MKTLLTIGAKTYTADLTKPIDLSLPLQGNAQNPQAWYLGEPVIAPVTNGNWIGKVSEGASVNFNSIQFSPHAHATHTESYGHISTEFYSISEALTSFFFSARVLTVKPEVVENDKVLPLSAFASALKTGEVEALVIRSLPNENDKKHKHYDHSNWPYIPVEAMQFIREVGIKHLLIDLPSVDKEEGDVVGHRSFWNYPESPRKEATITELIYVPNSVKDGLYLLNLQAANFKNDAAPSRPILFPLTKVDSF